jgi:hypothetical protein
MSEEMQHDAAAVSEVQSGDAPVVTPENEASATATDAAASSQPAEKSEDRSWQSRYDRLIGVVSKDLLGYAQQYGGGQNIVNFLKQFETVLGHPTIGPLAQQLLKTGNVELPKSKNEWDETPAEDPWKPQFNSLLAELQSVKQELTSMKTQNGMQKITSHTAQFLKEYPLDDSERARFTAAMDERLGSLATTPAGASLLNSMDYRSFKSLALPEIEEDIERIVARKAAKNRTQVVQRATDAPAVGANGQEKRPNGALPQNPEQLKRQVREAFLRAMNS